MKLLLLLLSLFVGKCKAKQEMVTKWRSVDCKHDYLIEIVRSNHDSIQVNFSGKYNADSISYYFIGKGRDFSYNDSIMRFLVEYNSIKLNPEGEEKIKDRETSGFADVFFPRLLLGRRSGDSLLSFRITPLLGLGRSDECKFRLESSQ